MYRIVALILMILFYCIYYGKLISQKRVGIQTNQLKNQSKGMDRQIGWLMSLATVLVPAAEIISIVFNVSSLPSFFRIIGILLAITGDVLFLVSVVTMGNSWRAGVSKTEKTELITEGIYSMSRNPAFLAFDLVYAGLLLMFFSWWHLVFVLFAIIMLHLQIVMIEEPFLPSVFGQAYIDYSKKVCRYIGRKK